MSCSLSSLWATTHSSLSLVICSVGSHFLSSGPNSSLRPPYFLPSMLTGLFNKFLCSNCRVGVGQRAGTQETLAPSPRLSHALPSYPGTWFEDSTHLQGSTTSTQSQGLCLQVSKQLVVTQLTGPSNARRLRPCGKMPFLVPPSYLLTLAVLPAVAVVGRIILTFSYIRKQAQGSSVPCPRSPS